MKPKAFEFLTLLRNERMRYHIGDCVIDAIQENIESEYSAGWDFSFDNMSENHWCSTDFFSGRTRLTIGSHSNCLGLRDLKRKIGTMSEAWEELTDVFTGGGLRNVRSHIDFSISDDWIHVDITPYEMSEITRPLRRTA
jgi:hypothetical protein